MIALTCCSPKVRLPSWLDLLPNSTAPLLAAPVNRLNGVPVVAGTAQVTNESITYTNGDSRPMGMALTSQGGWLSYKRND
jgi:hypothetical protein